MDDNEHRRAMDKALTYLGYRARSVAQMRAYLAGKGFSEPAVEAAIGKLKDYGYLDDEKLAAHIVEVLGQERGMGKRAVQQKLYRAGIDSQQAKEAADAIEPDEEREHARAWADRLDAKLSEDDPRRRKEKLFRRLIAKGFGYDIVKEILDKMDEERG